MNEAEVDDFLEFACFFYEPMDVDNVISGSSAFLKSSLNIWKFRFTYCWSLAWRILSITLLACEMSAVVWTFFGTALLWDWNENWPFPVLWPLLSFFFHIECSTALSFRIWSHTVTLFLVFQGTTVMFPIEAAPVYIPTNSVGRFSFLYTFSSIYYLPTFWKWPFWQVWGDISL